MVSIIVTTFNYAHYLDETLTSVRDQTHTDWECIVVDSGSSDNTRDVVGRFIELDKRFSFIQRTNSGVSASRNAGIKVSHGEYVQFLDGDDLFQKNKIASQLEAFRQNKEADIVYGDVRFFDDGSPENLRTSLKGNKPDDWLPRISGKGNVVLSQLKKINFFVTHSPLIKKSLVEKEGVFSENMAALEDWDLWLRYALSGAYFHFHKGVDDLVLVRVHENSLSKNAKLMRRGNFLMLRNAIANRNAAFGDKVYFILKLTELFWDNIFTTGKPPLPFGLVVISVLLLPVWLIIKLIRLIK